MTHLFKDYNISYYAFERLINSHGQVFDSIEDEYFSIIKIPVETVRFFFDKSREKIELERDELEERS